MFFTSIEKQNVVSAERLQNHLGVVYSIPAPLWLGII